MSESITKARTQVLVVQKVDSAIQRINHYPADNTTDCVNTYLRDSDLSGGWRDPPF